MRKLWLIFAQTATVAVGVLFVVTTLKPEWLGRPAAGPQVVELRQASTSPGSSARAASYSDAVRKAVPAVVNIFTSKEIKTPRHPLLDDPLFRHFFGDRLEDEPQRAASLGSGVIVSPKGYVLTNHHVVEAADEIEVALADGKKLKAKAVGSHRLGLQFLAVGERHLDLVGRLDDVMIGENVSLGADDHARAEACRALRLVFEAVSEKMPEQGVVEERMARRLDFLAGENIDDRRYGFPHRIAVGGRTRGGPRRRGSLAQFDHLRPGGGAAEPLGLQRGDHEEHADCNGGRLGEDEPELAHELSERDALFVFSR